MTTAAAWGWPVAVGLLAWVMTAILRRYALARGLIDIPNPRSSHAVATPRGGGGAIVVAATLAMSWHWWTGSPDALPLGVLAGGLIVAGVGFIDDHRHVAPAIRLASHTSAAMLAVWSFGDAMPSVAAAGLAVVGVTWLINLTNFMDGIDGIAGVQTLTVCAVGGVLSCVVAPGATIWFEPTMLAAASLGFLVWNWPPARIFLGDVGSGYIGFMIGALTLRAASAATELGWVWVILSGVFVVDATVTLALRAARRERLIDAHRTHAYQRLALRWGTHRPVTLLVAGVNLLWLAPIAALVAVHILSGPVAVALAYGPLAVAAGLVGWTARQTADPC